MKKIIKFKSVKELESYIKNHSESDLLEYKPSYILYFKNDSDQVKKKRDLLESVSAFANTKGGLIVIGVSENKKKNLYNLDNGVIISEWNEKRLQDLIYGNIEPSISDLKIIFIKKNKNSGYFLIYVPEGVTAYQNKIDKKYYGRFGENDLALDDYWIKLLISKTQKPLFDIYLVSCIRSSDNNKLRLAFRIKIKNKSNVSSKDYAIEIITEESLGLFYVKHIADNYNIIVQEEIHSINSKKFKKIYISSNYHLGNQVILLPQQEIEIKRFNAPFYIGFDKDQPEGLLKVVIYSENPQPQYFYYKFTSKLCNEILNKLKQGVIQEGESIIYMNGGKL